MHIRYEHNLYTYILSCVFLRCTNTFNLLCYTYRRFSMWPRQRCSWPHAQPSFRSFKSNWCPCTTTPRLFYRPFLWPLTAEIQVGSSLRISTPSIHEWEFFMCFFYYGLRSKKLSIADFPFTPSHVQSTMWQHYDINNRVGRGAISTCLGSRLSCPDISSR